MEHFHYCPQCGKKALKGDGRRIACSTCGFVFYFNTASAVAGIVQKDDSVLLVTRAKEPQKGKLDLPGGFVDHQETAEHALQREIREELNIGLPISGFLARFPINIYTKKSSIRCWISSSPAGGSTGRISNRRTM